MTRTRDNALGESACWAIKSGVRHKLLGSHFNSRKWVPFDMWYDMEGHTDMPNISPSWLPHLRKGINKEVGERRRDWNKKWGRGTWEKRGKSIMVRRKFGSDYRVGAQLPSWPSWTWGSLALRKSRNTIIITNHFLEPPIVG